MEAKIVNIRNERAIDSTDTKRKIREYHKQLYANEFDNLDEMDRFLKRQN